MSKPAGLNIGQWIGVCVSAALAGVGIVALRHALETPQPLKSILPGEAHLYRWQRRSIFYKVLGPEAAPPLVLLHRVEIGASGYEMSHIMSPLAQNYRVYALDLLGFGLSDRSGAEYSAELYNTLCQDFLREVVQQPATLVASGLSCNYAVTAAANAPDLCTSLVLISPLALQGVQQPSPLKQYAENPLVKALLYPLLSTRLAFLLTRRLRQERQEDFAQFYANTHQLGAEHAAMALLAGKLTENAEQQFARLQQPVLMIWGTHALDSQQTVAKLHKTAMLANPTRQARKVELIQGAALAAYAERPEEVITAIRNWQKETHEGELLSSEQMPAFKLKAADQQSTRTSATLVLPEQTAPPRPVKIRSSDRPVDASIAASMLTPAKPDEEVTEPATPEFSAAISTPTPTSSDKEMERSQPAPLSNNSVAEPEIIAYCVKCKQKRAMLQAREVIMKNGHPAMRGICPVCGTRLNRIGGIS